MVDVLVNTDDITIFGPPDTIDLQVDVGPQGTRGSKFFVGSGNPNAQTSSGQINSQTVNLGDLFINAAPGSGYGYVYEYKAEPGGNVWVEALNINPTIYSVNYAAIFEDGVAQVVIPINDIIQVSTTPLTAEDFNVKYNIAHVNPIASSMEIQASSSDLIIDINAVEYESSSWVPLGDTGTYTSGLELTTHIQVTILPAVV